MVRPYIEYANQVKKHVAVSENVQRHATKSIPGLSNLSYEERLRKINIPTLTYRRSRGNMIETHKIFTGKYDPEVSKFLKLREDACTR